MSTTDTLLAIVAAVLITSRLRELYDGIKLIGNFLYWPTLLIGAIICAIPTDMYESFKEGNDAKVK